MDTFLTDYFELSLDGCELDIINDIKLRLIKSGNWIITGNLEHRDSWTVTIGLDIDLEYDVKLDITRYVKRVMDVELNELFVAYTSSEFIKLIKCLNDRKQLHVSLTKIIKGYMPIICSDCYIMKWKREQKDSYAFIMDVLLRECFADGTWNARMETTLHPLPAFIDKIDSSLFKRICTGLELIRNMDCSGGKSDMDIEIEMYRISWIAYEVIRCALMNFNVYCLESIDSNSIIGKDSITIYKVNYNNPAVCEKFDKLMACDGHMAYHGSSIMNWYSIVYNGLFVAKGTLVTNGAAYGTGIYLSDSSNFSMGYSSRGNGIGSNIILGVFQVEDAISVFKKTNNIYVVPDEKKICLRYLIYMKPSYTANVCVNIDKYFISGEMVKASQKVETVINNAWSRRVMGEIRELHARDGIMCDDGLRYLVNDCDTMSVIVLSLCRDTFGDSALGKDMDTMGIDVIKMEVRLPSAYPFEPPFIRVLSPKFAFRKGHVTIGGSICMDLLTKQRWLPSMSISKIIITIVQNMIAGDGRLEPGGKNYVYSLHEAQSAFTRMLATHSGEW
jgi:hypothetical protein